MYKCKICNKDMLDSEVTVLQGNLCYCRGCFKPGLPLLWYVEYDVYEKRATGDFYLGRFDSLSKAFDFVEEQAAGFSYEEVKERYNIIPVFLETPTVREKLPSASRLQHILTRILFKRNEKSRLNAGTKRQ